jgi:hypothetical protein
MAKAKTSRLSTYKTLGAISGHFPSAAQRKRNTKSASESIGAQIARQVAAAEMTPSSKYIGLCSKCETHRYGDPEVPCGRCEIMASQPEKYVIGPDGTWWSKEALLDHEIEDVLLNGRK